MEQLPNSSVLKENTPKTVEELGARIVEIDMEIVRLGETATRSELEGLTREKSKVLRELAIKRGEATIDDENIDTRM